MNRYHRLFLILIMTGMFPTTGLHAEDAQEAREAMEGPFVIHDLALDPGHPETVYAITSNYGFLKSPDGGKTWVRSNKGLRSYTHHALVIDPVNPNIIYVGAWGGGVSKSLDGGLSWTGINKRLGNTAIEKIAVDSSNPEMLYTATTSGIFKSPDGGADWIPFSEGLPVSEIGLYQDIFIIPHLSPGDSPDLFLSTNIGLFGRKKGKGIWERVSMPTAEIHPTRIGLNPKSGDLFLGALKTGVWVSRDKGLTWMRLTESLGPTWVTDIAFDPFNPLTVFISTRMKGILKSHDGGKSWNKMNKGIPGIDVRCLAVHPENPQVIYAGTPHNGVLKTTDGGETWFSLKGFPILKMSEIINPLDRWPEKGKTTPVEIPPEFFKCNLCHGWADPHLNAKQTYWRVPANERDWAPTVGRMRVRARLAPEEERIITDFLSAYTKP